MTNQTHKQRLADMKRMRKNRYTLREIGEKYGVTKQAIWNGLNRDLKKTLTKS